MFSQSSRSVLGPDSRHRAGIHSAAPFDVAVSEIAARDGITRRIRHRQIKIIHEHIVAIIPIHRVVYLPSG